LPASMRKTHFQENLTKGDQVALIAPAGIIPKEVKEHALQICRRWGVEAVFGKHISNNFFKYSAPDEQRKADLLEALEDPEIKAIWSLRGGYGAIRIMDDEIVRAISDHPKWFIGYSDMTVMHSVYNTQRLCTVHGEMAVKVEPDEFDTVSLNTLRDLLFERKNEYDLTANRLNKTGIATAELVGGNLAVLCGLMGTPFFPETEGKILFIEDVREYAYRIDRKMQQLKAAGILEKISGLVVGGLTDIYEGKDVFGKDAEEIIYDAVSEYDYPVIFNFPAGHVSDNRALLFGGMYYIESSTGVKVKLLS
jgi:muramoyltetrapeptide carboxypeptidase